MQEWIVDHAPGRKKVEEGVQEKNGANGDGGGDKTKDKEILGKLPVMQVAAGGALLRVTSRLQSQTPFLDKKHVSMRASSGSFQVEIDSEDNLVYPTGRDSTSYPSVVGDGVCLVNGRWYYECTVLMAVPRGARECWGVREREMKP